MRGRAVTFCVAVGLVAALDAIALAPLFRDRAPVEPVAGAAPVLDAPPGSVLAAAPAEPAVTEPPATSATTSAPPVAEAAPTTPAPPAPATTLRRITPERVVAATRGPGLPVAFQGLGTWVDVFDFNPAHTNGPPPITAEDVDAMAAAGVETVYLQAARPEDPKAPGDLVSPDLLRALTARAHSHGMRVVGWYLPHFSNLDDDMRHLEAMIEFSAGGRRFDALALDIEWRAAVPDPAVRNERLVELSERLQRAAAAKGLPVGAIVLPPVLLDHVNPNYWPGFPWKRLRPFYDAWLPMGYWTDRIGEERQAHHHTVHNVSLLRQYLGDVPIHFAGGIGNKASAADYEGFAKAVRELGLGGLSVYDWATTGAGPMRYLRD